jgi:hypothetical protein
LDADAFLDADAYNVASPPKRDFPSDEKNILVAPDDNQHL